MEAFMEFSKLSTPSLKSLFIKEMQHMILSGKLAEGERLPPERDLSEQMQVSRSIVNGGIRELERMGFLSVSPRSGTFVTDFKRCGNLETLAAIMQYNGGRLRRNEVRSILEVRIALDRLIVDLLIPKITDREVERLGAIVGQIRTAQSTAAAIDAAFAFQMEMALCSGNTLVPLIFTSFKTVVYSLWDRFCTLYGIGALYENNAGLWERIRDRDAPGAAAWIERSIGDSIDGERVIYYG
jgi:DNA-binding FadR family transcriptional regulator